MLQPLIGGGITRGQPRVHRLHRFALAVVEQALDVPTGALALGPTTEPAGKPIEKLAEAPEDGPRGGDRLVHGGSGEPLIAKAPPDVPMKIGPRGRGGAERLDDPPRHGEIAVDGAVPERQVERRVARIRHRREQRRLEHVRLVRTARPRPPTPHAHNSRTTGRTVQALRHRSRPATPSVGTTAWPNRGLRVIQRAAEETTYGK